MPTLLIADDHPLSRAALRGAAADAVADLQVREAESLDSVLAVLEAEPGVDLVLLDLHMPGNHGLADLAAIRAQHPGVAVVVSANDDPRVSAAHSTRAPTATCPRTPGWTNCTKRSAR
ncbi:MAG: response regulator [Luteimonas sp.]